MIKKRLKIRRFRLLTRDCKLGGQTSFFNNQSSSTGIAESTRNDIYIHGININNFQLTTEESTKENITTSVNVDVSSSGLKKTSHVYGIKASNSSLTFNHPLTITASGQTTGTTAAVALDESSHFEAKSSLGIEARNDEGSLAIAFELSNGANVAISSENTTNGNASFIIGNIQTNGNLFSINRNDPFIIIGAIDSGESNKNTEITLSNADSRWVVADDSSLDSLTLEKSMLSLDIGKHWKSIDESAFHEVNVNNLTLNQATLQVKVDLSGETSKSDAVKATSVNGNGIVDVRIVGDVTEHKSMSEGVGFLYQDNGELTLQLADKNGDGKPDQVTYQNGSLLGWKLAYKAEESTEGNTDTLSANSITEDFSDSSVSGSGKGYWYLTTGNRAEIPEPEPDPDPDPDQPDNPDKGGDTPLPPEVAQILSLGTSAAQAVSWLAEKEDLRHRLGEIRYGAIDGAWVKVFNKQNRVSDGYGFKQESTGIHLGLDRVISQSANGQWLVGAALRYAEADQEGLLDGNGSNGELKEYSAKLYATYMDYSGSYWDIATQFGYYDQEIQGLANDYLTSMKASYDTYGYGVSAELGHHFKIEDQKGSSWFIEPSTEVSYFYVNGKKYKTSTDIEVSPEEADFLTARAGVAFGRTVQYGTGLQNYFQFALDAGVYYEFMGDQDLVFTDEETIV